MASTLLQRALGTVLRPFSKVEPKEAPTVALMTLVAFLLLAAYYLLKTVREPLILLQGGAETKLYARAAQTLIMVGVVYAYGELARRVGRIFWMKDTYIPLDIYFYDAQGNLVDVARNMRPQNETKDPMLFRSKPAQFVVEVLSGSIFPGNSIDILQCK